MEESAVAEATGYTLIRGHGSGVHGSARALLVSDDGVAYRATEDRRSWRCLGIVVPEELFDDLGLLDGSSVGLTVEDYPPYLATPTTM
jgi:hypothetical protein